MEDSQILELLYERSERAIAALSEKYGSVCRRVANNILNDARDVEECVNDAYLGAWNTIPPQKPQPLRSYVCRIVRNLAIKRYHANTAAKRNSCYDVAPDELENCFPAADTVEEAFHAGETARILDRFLAALDKESRVMFVRRYWYADPVTDIAALFHTSSHTVSVRLFRIRQRLKKYLIQEGVSL